MKKFLKNSKIGIVGGGRVCKAILTIILENKFGNHETSILGVVDTREDAEGLLYAREKGIFTSDNYKDLYRLADLNVIIELTGNNSLLDELKARKPANVRLIDHFEAMSVWDFLQIEEERIKVQRRLREPVDEEAKIESAFENFSQQLSNIVEERTKHLQSVERALSQIIGGNTMPTFVINKNHIVTYWNRAIENLTGYKGNEIVGTNKQWVPFRSEQQPIAADFVVDDMGVDEIKRQYTDKWRRSTLIENAYEVEEFFPHMGEKGKWLFFTAAPIKDGDGKTVGAIETLWDTTERKEAQNELQRAHDELESRVEERTAELKRLNEELRRSEEKYKTLFDSAPNSIFIMERQSLKIIDVNMTALDCYGRSREDFFNMTFLDLLYEPDKSFATELKGLPEDQCCFYPRRRHVKKGGEPFYVNIMAVRHAMDIWTDCVIATTTDINESVEKEAQLIQASKMTTLGEMSAGIAHELNQPLNAIKMGSEFLKMMIEQGKNVPEKDLHQVVNEVGNQVDRAAEIIVHLKEYGRKCDFTREEVDINEAIRSIFKIVCKQLNLQNIEVNLDLDDSIPPILAHKNRLQQVIFNLVTNARDAINQKHDGGVVSASGKIRISSFWHEDRVAISVSDTGIGIPESQKDKVFEAFFTTKEIGEGMGLGLSISHEIIKGYDGDIQLESEKGEGSIFRISFPPVSD